MPRDGKDRAGQLGTLPETEEESSQPNPRLITECVYCSVMEHLSCTTPAHTHPANNFIPLSETPS